MLYRRAAGIEPEPFFSGQIFPNTASSALIIRTQAGLFGANFYIVADGAAGDAFAVDCGGFGAEERAFVKSTGIARLRYILLTHGHFDHIAGVKALKDEFGGEVCIHAADAACLSDPALSLDSTMGGRTQQPITADRTLSDGDILPFGGSEITVLHTPGHTPGSVCYLWENCLFSGDTLFYMSIGNTGLPRGDGGAMNASLEKLVRLPRDYLLFPGHGRDTTLENERRFNPWLRNIE